MEIVAEHIGKTRRTEDPLILLVDDDPQVLAAVRRCLRADGYDLITAETGAEALERLSLDSVDLVIADQRMPDMTGTDLLRQIRELSPLTSCAILTGYKTPSVIREGGLAGAGAVLFKPWNEKVLRKTVRRLLGLTSGGEAARP
jgi:response regulator RpfG family c-di-GMP phosphodiesterase